MRDRGIVSLLLAALSASWEARQARKRYRREQRERAREHGVCPGCGEVLDDPIHAWHCPYRRDAFSP